MSAMSTKVQYLKSKKEKSTANIAAEVLISRIQLSYEGKRNSCC